MIKDSLTLEERARKNERVHALEVIAREALSGRALSWEDGD